MSGLTKRYAHDQCALEDVTLAVADGEMVSLLGANGAGKSTLINCILDFITPSEGRIVLDDHDVRLDSLAARGTVAYLPESVSLYGALSGFQNARFFTELRRGAEPGDDEVVAAARRVGITAAELRARVSAYSKGMRQRLGIAIAVLCGARNVILDEPTSGLDPQATEEFLAMLRVLRDDGRAVLMSTHDAYRALRDSDRLLVLRRGRVVFEESRGRLSAMSVGEIIDVVGER